MKKTLLFDLDGTLIDSTPAILASFDIAFQTLKLPKFNEEKLKSLIGFPLDEMFIKLNPDKKEFAQEFIEHYREHYRKVYLEQTTLLPRAKEAVSLASEFADIAVVTTKGSQFTKPLLDFLGVGQFFKVIVGRNDVEFPKPHKEPILTALKRLQKGQENAFMIGDTKLDILAAKNAEISCVAVSCGYESEESLKAQCKNVKHNAYEAVKFISEI